MACCNAECDVAYYAKNIVIRTSEIIAKLWY